VETVREMYEVNVIGLLAVTKAFTPLLVASKGTILNNGSVAGHFHMPYHCMYNASKAAVAMISDTSRVELKPFGIKVLHVNTGCVETNFFENQPSNGTKLPEGSLYEPIQDQVDAHGKDWPFPPTSASDWARKVARKALNGSNGNVWIGGWATVGQLSILSTPRWLADILISIRYGINKLYKSNKN
jgi:1-acylglycerone phosphate reductase